MKLLKFLGFFVILLDTSVIHSMSISPTAIFNKLKPGLDTTRSLERAINALRVSYSTVASSNFKANQKKYQTLSYVPDALKTKLNAIATVQDKTGKNNLETAVLQTTELSEREQAFITNRLTSIAQTFEQLGNPRRGILIPQAIAKLVKAENLDSVPRIAVCASGGGFRAMIATMGFWDGMQRIGLDELVLMTSCLSGSTWFTTPWCIGKTIGQLQASYDKYALIPLGPQATSILNNPLALPQSKATAHCLFPELSVISDKFSQDFYWFFPYNLVQAYGNLIGHMTLASFDDPTILQQQTFGVTADGEDASQNQADLQNFMYDPTSAPYTGPNAVQSRQTVYFSQAADFLQTPEGYKNRPLPLATSITAFEGSWSKTANTISKEQNSFDGYTWITYSPFDIAMDFYDRKGNRTGARIKTEYFGRKYDNIRTHSRTYRIPFTNGKTIGYASVTTSPEYTLSYLQGIWGSAFAISIDYILNGSGLDGSVNPEDMDTTATSKDNNSSIMARVKSALNWSLKHSLTTLTSFNNFRLFPAVINNFAVFPDSPFADYDTLITVDAGIAFNLPFPPLLKPERKIDMIIALDASADVNERLDALVGAEQWAQTHGIPFPIIKKSAKYKTAHQKAFTIFDEFPDGVTGPLVFYIPLVDHCFDCSICERKETSVKSCIEGTEPGTFSMDTCLKGACSTFNFAYKPSEVNGLAWHISCRIKNIRNNMLDAIEQVIRKKNNLALLSSDALNSYTCPIKKKTQSLPSTVSVDDSIADDDNTDDTTSDTTVAAALS